MRLILQIMFVALFALCLGLGSARYVARSNIPFSTVSIGAWRANPHIGKPDIDAYSLAYLSTSGEVPLAVVDGIAFEASTDDTGKLLDARCNYRITGTFDRAPLWTFVLVDSHGNIIQNPAKREVFTSEEVIREPDGEIAITIASEPQGGNWMPAPDVKSFKLSLRFYDVAVNAFRENDGRASLPRITRGECI